MLISARRKCFPILVTIFALYGRLNHAIFLFLLVSHLVFTSCSVSAPFYGLIEFLNIFVHLPTTMIILILLTLKAV